MKLRVPLFALLLSLTLASCGGGSSSTPPPPATVLVSSITITPIGNPGSWYAGNPFWVAAAVQPVSAANPSLTWSVQGQGGSATVSSAGLLSAQAPGAITVKAAAQDGSGVVGALQLAIQPLQAAPSQPQPNTRFITRAGDQLMDGDSVFRFLSFNVPNLHVVEDPSWHRVVPFEQQDAMQSIAQMGGRVARIYTFSIAGGMKNTPALSHYSGPNQLPLLNEELMVDYDHMLQAASQNGVRIIVPLIDQWSWWGGITEFSQICGGTGNDFYTNPAVVADFKQMVQAILTRANTLTGVAYKDDPTILGWETGNELQSPPQSWTSGLAAFIKGIDSNHLVIDGMNGSTGSLGDPNVDILVNHYYSGDYAQRAASDRMASQGQRVFLVGEYGLAATPELTGLMDEVIADGASGALIWSLRFHSAEGGFYWHSDSGYFSYHWPGFESNAVSDEINVLTQNRQRAFAIQGCNAPAVPAPEPPALLPITTPAAIAWQGSAGAQSYLLERSSDQLNWSTLATGLLDSGNPYAPYNDASATSPGNYYYRLTATDSAGNSQPSAAVSYTVP